MVKKSLVPPFYFQKLVTEGTPLVEGEEENVRYQMEVFRCYSRAMDRQISEHSAQLGT